MALTATEIKSNKTSGEFIGIALLTFSGSYATNGESMDFSTIFGFTKKTPDFVSIIGITGYKYAYIYATGKVKVMDLATGVELPASAYPAAVSNDLVRARITWLP